MARVNYTITVSKALKGFLMILFAGVLIAACKSDPNSPGVEYMPDMYRSPTFETYGENEISGTKIMSARLPANNTIARGSDNLPYPYPNTIEGYEAAGVNLKNPLEVTERSLADAKVLFTRYCVHCHGKKGLGDGTVPTNSEYPQPPSYSGALKDLPEGKIFHTLNYGKNLMGSHASQMTKTERWNVILYVQTLQKLGGTSAKAENNKEQEESK